MVRLQNVALVKLQIKPNNHFDVFGNHTLPTVHSAHKGDSRAAASTILSFLCVWINKLHTFV